MRELSKFVVIVDKKTKIIYWQFMDVLEKGDSFQTKSANPRLIFHLVSFNKWDIG